MTNLIKRSQNNNHTPIRSLQRQIDNLFDNFFDDFSDSFSANFTLNKNLQPNVNISEDNKAYYVDAELPGIKKEDIKLEYRDDGILSISAKSQSESEVKEKNYHHIECHSGSYYRSFSLPNNVERKNINAEMKDGLLKIILPKGENSNGKINKINIK